MEQLGQTENKLNLNKLNNNPLQAVNFTSSNH